MSGFPKELIPHEPEPATVPCRICGVTTGFTGTKLCDRCWELEHRIQGSPELARLILAALNPEQVCECGNPRASWHGERDGFRVFCCDQCWAIACALYTLRNMTLSTKEQAAAEIDQARRYLEVAAVFSLVQSPG